MRYHYQRYAGDDKKIALRFNPLMHNFSVISPALTHII